MEKVVIADAGMATALAVISRFPACFQDPKALLNRRIDAPLDDRSQLTRHNPFELERGSLGHWYLAGARERVAGWRFETPFRSSARE